MGRKLSDNITDEMLSKGFNLIKHNGSQYSKLDGTLKILFATTFNDALIKQIQMVGKISPIILYDQSGNDNVAFGLMTPYSPLDEHLISDLDTIDPVVSPIEFREMKTSFLFEKKKNRRNPTTRRGLIVAIDDNIRLEYFLNQFGNRLGHIGVPTFKHTEISERLFEN